MNTWAKVDVSELTSMRERLGEIRSRAQRVSNDVVDLQDALWGVESAARKAAAESPRISEMAEAASMDQNDAEGRGILKLLVQSAQALESKMGTVPGAGPCRHVLDVDAKRAAAWLARSEPAAADEEKQPEQAPSYRVRGTRHDGTDYESSHLSAITAMERHHALIADPSFCLVTATDLHGRLIALFLRAPLEDCEQSDRPTTHTVELCASETDRDTVAVTLPAEANDYVVQSSPSLGQPPYFQLHANLADALRDLRRRKHSGGDLSGCIEYHGQRIRWFHREDPRGDRMRDHYATDPKPEGDGDVDVA